jgi:hydrogenase expression/formation protein HypC
MCLAVPMQVIEADGPRGVVESSGVRYEIRLDLVGDVRIGEFVLVHAGYAIQVMDEAAAAEQIALLESLASGDEDDPLAPHLPPASPPGA